MPDTPPVTSAPSFAKGMIQSPNSLVLFSKDLKDELHRHRVGTTGQPLLGETAQMVDERDVQLRLERTARAKHDRARSHGDEFGYERLDDARLFAGLRRCRRARRSRWKAFAVNTKLRARNSMTESAASSARYLRMGGPSQGAGHQWILLRHAAAKVESEILAHVRVRIAKTVHMVLGGARRLQPVR